MVPLVHRPPTHTRVLYTQPRMSHSFSRRRDDDKVKLSRASNCQNAHVLLANAATTPRLSPEPSTPLNTVTSDKTQTFLPLLRVSLDSYFSSSIACPADSLAPNRSANGPFDSLRSRLSLAHRGLGLDWLFTARTYETNCRLRQKEEKKRRQKKKKRRNVQSWLLLQGWFVGGVVKKRHS